MKLTDILTPDCTICAVSGTSKKRILDTICTVAAEKIAEHDPIELLESLMAREKLGSTGIGNGIAIPHGRLTKTNQVVAVFITTEQPIPFDAIDHRPVDIFVALFVPENCCQEHLSTLQGIAKLLSEKQVVKQIRKCETDQALFSAIESASQAAA